MMENRKLLVSKEWFELEFRTPTTRWRLSPYRYNSHAEATQAAESHLAKLEKPEETSYRVFMITQDRHLSTTLWDYTHPNHVYWHLQTGKCDIRDCPYHQKVAK